MTLGSISNINVSPSLMINPLGGAVEKTLESVTSQIKGGSLYDGSPAINLPNTQTGTLIDQIVRVVADILELIVTLLNSSKNHASSAANTGTDASVASATDGGSLLDDPLADDSTSLDLTDSVAPSAVEKFSKPGFEKSVRSTASGEKQINEEQLQHAIVNYLTSLSGEEASSVYLSSYRTAFRATHCEEESVKQALRDVVHKGYLSLSQAEEINGTSFAAAQLDDKEDLLFDGKGGPGDNTVAIAALNKAIAKAEGYLSGVKAGSILPVARPLDAQGNRPGIYES